MCSTIIHTYNSQEKMGQRTLHRTQATLKHNLNDIADDLAGSGNNPPILHPLYEAELVHNNSTVTSKLQQIVTAAIHTATLQ